MLQYVNDQVDPDDQHRMVRLRDCFKYRHCCAQSQNGRHYICLVFERLQCSLFDLLRSHYSSWMQSKQAGRPQNSVISSRESTDEEKRWSCRGFSLKFVRTVTVQVSTYIRSNAHQ